jgi:CRISPR-associated protein Cas5, N-terminal domain
MDRRYPVSFEIAGSTALFARPDGGSTPISYPVPTWSAVKGMFEAVARCHGAYLHPTHVEICRPIRTTRYTTNYGGPLRKAEQIKKGNNLQLIATVLFDVCYRVHGQAVALEPGNGVNRAHALQDIFQRRLAAGKLFYTPCLGWKEFTPSYFGPLRPESRADTSVNLYIPSLLYSVFDAPVNGKWGPRFQRGVQVRHGVLEYTLQNDDTTGEPHA